MMDDMDFWEVDNFYTWCDKCGTWIEFNRIMPRPKSPITDYEMTIKPNFHDVKAEKKFWAVLNNNKHKQKGGNKNEQKNKRRNR